jgi:arylsulfatase A-like enzyme
MKSIRITLSFWSFGLIFLTGLACQKKENIALSEKPNIVIINVDDLGWKDLGYMGSQYYETPHIDRLATEGMTFQHAYAAAANCAPSRPPY